MAVFIQMRNKLGVLIVVVIAVAIIGFLVMDISDSTGGFNSRQKNVVGKIGSEKIKLEEFNAMIAEVSKDQLLLYPQSVQDEQFNGLVNNQAWAFTIHDVLMGDEFDKTGLSVTDEEVIAVFLSPTDPHPLVKQFFPDPSMIPTFVANINNPQIKPQDLELWNYIKRQVRKDAYQNKYEALVRKAIYVPGFIAEQEYLDANTTASIQYVYLPYSSVDDASVTAEISDRDLEKYLSAHEKESVFQQEESVKMSFVSWPIVPSREDTLQLRSQFMKLFEEFSSNTTFKQDSIFVRLNSEEPFNNILERYFTKEDMDKSILMDTLFMIDTMNAIGPFLEDGFFKGVKVIDRKMIPDSVQVKHIIIPVETQEQVTVRRALADSLATQIDSFGVALDSVMNMLPGNYLELNASPDWGWIKRGGTPPTFTNYSDFVNNFLFFEGKEGDVKVLPGEQGFEIVQIMKSNPEDSAVRLSYVAVKIETSPETEKAIFNIANEYASANTNPEDFTKAGELMKMRTEENLRPSDFSVMGLGVSRELVQWAFEAEEGEISPVLAVGNQYVVAMVEKKREKGTRELEEVRDIVMAKVLIEKKEEILKTKFEETLASSSDLSAIASALSSNVSSAENLSFIKSQLSTGDEPKIAAAATGLTPNTISKPISGTLGVYVIQVTSAVPAAPMSDYSTFQSQVANRLNQISERKTDQGFGILLSELIEKKDVKDYRINFY